MEIVTGFFIVGLLIYMVERREQRALFPDQKCTGYRCEEPVHYDFKRHMWMHDSGQQWLPAGPYDNMHPAMGDFGPNNYGV